MTTNTERNRFIPFFVLFLFLPEGGTAQSIQLIDRLSVDWTMAYKNLNSDSQK